MLATQTLSGGFANPVFEAQSVFRAVMNGLANPGTVDIAGTQAHAPAPFGKAAASILLTLCDFETPVWLSPSLASDSVRGWVSFHAGAPLADEPKHSAFAFAANSAELPALSSFAPGNDEYPDTSTTIIVEIEALQGGAPVLLKGPGIKGNRMIAPAGLPRDFIGAWELNSRLYPCGVDLILTAGAQFLCLPRTTRMQEP